MSSPIMMTSTTSPTSSRNRRNQSIQNFKVQSSSASQNAGCVMVSINHCCKPRRYQQIS